ncbi:MAG: TIGR01777 family oxidoreductase [bacterium]
MKVLLTGGTGLIGRHLVPQLVERGDRVVCLTRHETRARSLLPVGVEILETDAAQTGPWQDVVSGCDAVINLAGESIAAGNWSDRRKQRIRRSRLDITRNLVDALDRQDGPVVLLSASATGYYGDCGDTALGESNEPGLDFLARLAREWEATALTAESSTTRVVLLRIGIVLARDGGALPLLRRPFRFGLGGAIGSGRQYFPWIHIDDLVRVFLFALHENDLSGPVNAVAPDPPTQRAFARALGRAVHRPSLLPLPAFFLRLLLGEKGEMLLASQRAVPKALRARRFRFTYDNLDDALADLVRRD